MLLVPTIIRCCAHIVRLVCGRTDKPSTVTLRRMRRGLLMLYVLHGCMLNSVIRTAWMHVK